LTRANEELQAIGHEDRALIPFLVGCEKGCSDLFDHALLIRRQHLVDKRVVEV
jgi:hypothetical protein